MNKQDSKIIGEFMEVDIMYHEDWDSYFYEFHDGKNVRTYYLNEWNGLMPAIEKIGKIGGNISSKYDFKLMKGDNLYTTFGVLNMRIVSIDIICKEVVEFINWYNKQKN